MKRNIVTLVLCLTVVILCSCSRNKELKSGGKITIWHMESAGDRSFLEKLARSFEAKMGGRFLIELVHYSIDDIHQQYQNASIAGTGPDLVLVPSDKGGIFNIGGFIHPVEDYFDLREYVDIAIDAVRERGHVWGIPFNTGNHIMLFYNKSLVKSAPQTTDQLFEICSALKAAKKDIYCIATNIIEPYFFIPWFTSFGGWVFDSGGRPTLDSEAMRLALEFTKDLTEKFSPPQCEYTCMDGLFKEGKVAIVTNGDWALDSYKAALGNDFGVAILPENSLTKKRMYPMVSGKYFMINSKLKGEALERAVELIKHFTSYENQMDMYASSNRLPGLKKAFLNVEMKADPTTRAVLEQMKFGRPMPISVNMRAIWDVMRTQLAMYFAGKRKAADAAAKMQAEAVKKIAELKN